MPTITIPKIEYQQLLGKAFRYDYLKQVMTEDIFASPPIRDAKKALKEFQATNLYSPKFLNSLNKGLKRSSYFK